MESKFKRKGDLYGEFLTTFRMIYESKYRELRQKMQIQWKPIKASDPLGPKM